MNGRIVPSVPNDVPPIQGRRRRKANIIWESAAAVRLFLSHSQAFINFSYF